MKPEFEYRSKEFFNDKDTYVFKDMRVFESKVEFSKGHWWTVESLNYKATTLPCYKLLKTPKI